jgi:hypothetical protein
MCSVCNWEWWLSQAIQMVPDERYSYAVDRLDQLVKTISAGRHVTERQRSNIQNIQAKANPLPDDGEDQIIGEEPPSGP